VSIAYGVKNPLKGGIVTDGLILYLHPQLKDCWNGSSTSITDLVAGQSCTATDLTADADGNFVFNGSTSKIDTNNSYIDNGTAYTLSSTEDDYTLEAWIYVETSQGTTTDADSIIGSTTSYGVGMQVGISAGSPRINFAARSTSNFYGTAFNYNQWYHVVWAHETGVDTTVYMNATVDVSPTSVSSYSIGGSSWGNITIGNSSARITGFYDGKMGPVRMYKRALTSSEVSQNFNASKARYGL